MASKPATGSGRSLRRRRHRGHHEQRLRLWLLAATVAVALLVSGLVSYGLLQQYWLTPGRAVATVGQHAIPLRTLQQYTRYRRVQLLNEYFTYSELLQYVGEQRDQLQTRMDQLDEQLNAPLVLARQVLEELIVIELVRSEVAVRGISVSADEIEVAANAYFGYDPDAKPPTPLSTATIDLESQDVPASTPIPIPTPYTEAAYRETYADYLETLSADTGMNNSAFRNLFEQRLLSEKLREAMAAALEIAEEEQVRVRHILLSLDDVETARVVLTRALEGDDFATLAAEFSTDVANSDDGGDLGWFQRGQMVASFEKAVFAAEAGVLPELVATQFGLHVVEILDKEVRALPETVLAQRRRQAFDDWLSERRIEESVEIMDWWEESAPAEPTMQNFYERLQSEQGAD